MWFDLRLEFAANLWEFPCGKILFVYWTFEYSFLFVVCSFKLSGRKGELVCTHWGRCVAVKHKLKFYSSIKITFED